MNFKCFKFLSASLFCAAALSLAACGESKDEPKLDDNNPPLPPEEVPVETTVKPKAMWIDCQANFNALSKKAGIDAELEKIKKYGMNTIYLDVKSGNGYALYKSDFLPYCNTYLNLNTTRDYDDYLGYFLEKCEELEIDVIASIVATGWGVNYAGIKQGYIFDDIKKWEDKIQVRSEDKNPNKLVPMTDDALQTIVMLDPAYPEVQDLIDNTVREIVTKYPKIKGISLDYLRYGSSDTGGYYGMSDYNMQGYATYWGEAKPERTDILTADGGIGPKFAKWIEYRAMMVTNLISRINGVVKSINPDCEIHLWASSHWDSRFTVGQNWASKKYHPTGVQYTNTYSKTGFAELIDVFVTGAYVETIWDNDAPGSIWTVENFVQEWKYYLLGACKCYGSIAAYALTPDKIADATYLCLKNTDGYMTFELSHVNNGNKWQATLDGIKRYEGK